MPHGALIEPRLMADEIEAQIEEAANMGEPPSFALMRHQADWLVAFLRKASTDTPRCDALKEKLVVEGLPRDYATLCLELARQLERELIATEDDLMRWYIAASPYSTPEALSLALATSIR